MNGKLKFCTFSASISNIPWITSVCTCSVYMMTLLVIKAVFTWYATVHSKKPTITFYEYKKVNAYKRWFGGGGGMRYLRSVLLQKGTLKLRIVCPLPRKKITPARSYHKMYNERIFYKFYFERICFILLLM